MSVVHKVYGLLQGSQANTDRHEDDHKQQSIAVVRRIAALKHLRTNHQSTGSQHDPHRNGYATLARVLAVQLDPCENINNCQTCTKRRRSNLHVLWMGWYPTAKALTAVHRPHLLQRPAVGCTCRATTSVIKLQICASITHRPRRFVRSLSRANANTTASAKEAPTAARAFAVVRSNPRPTKMDGV